MIKKKELLKRIENLEEGLSVLMLERFVNRLNNIEIEKDCKCKPNTEPKKRGRKPKAKEEIVKPTPKKRGRKPKNQAK